MREHIIFKLDDISYTADVTVTYERCEYGADADGNKGLPNSQFIEDIIIHEIEDDNGELVEITPELINVVEEEVHEL